MSRWLDLARKADDEFSNPEPECEKRENCESRGGMSQLSQLAQFSHQGPQIIKHEKHPPEWLQANACAQKEGCSEVDFVPLSAPQAAQLVVPEGVGDKANGARTDDLLSAQIQHWRCCLAELPTPDSPWMAAVVEWCLKAVDEPWLREAVALGWSELELWGLDPGAPQLTARNGLVTGLYLSALKQPVKVVSINDVHAIIETGTGARHTHRARILNKGPVIWSGR